MIRQCLEDKKCASHVMLSYLEQYCKWHSFYVKIVRFNYLFTACVKSNLISICCCQKTAQKLYNRSSVGFYFEFFTPEGISFKRCFCSEIVSNLSIMDSGVNKVLYAYCY